MSQQVLTAELSEIITTHCGKIKCIRINKDLEYLISEYPNIRVYFDYELNIPIVLVKDRENEIKLKIKEYYPFKPVEIEVNSEPYIKLLVFNSNEKRKILKDVIGIDCLCCQSLMCETNWYAQLKLKDIVDEICKNIEIIYDVNNIVNNNNNNNIDSIIDDNKNINTIDITGYKRKLY